MPEGSVEKPSILIVEDTPLNIDILQEVLGDDYDLVVAINGLEALQVLETNSPPDLMLLDIMMPEMDGFETCRRIKSDDRYKMIPIIFLTAKTENQDLLKGFDLGAEDYVTKPFHIPELKARIKTHIEIQTNRRILTQKNRDFREMLHILCHDLANPLANIQSILNIMDDDHEGIADFIPDMSRTIRQGLEIIESIRNMRSLDEKGLTTSPVNLIEAWIDSSAMLRFRFIEKGVLLNPPDSSEPVWVLAEKISLMNSVINNILTNALKFTPGGKSVSVEIIRSNKVVIFSVKDEGIGIPADILAELFNPLSRLTHREGTDGEPGTGFGMPLVKEFMSAYGVSIDVVSEEGNGTEIILKFISSKSV